MILSGVNEMVFNVLVNVGIEKLVGAQNICSNINDAIERSKAIVEESNNKNSKR